MSRCFPFPPPGYENKPRSDHVDLLAKEKHKEKQHKKEKRDREKGEGKERKDKDRSKDEHKEKKDGKEKHQDKKRDKDKYKDKDRTSDYRRIRGRAEGHNEEKLGDCSWKAEEVKDSKFTEELDRRIRDEEGAAHRMFEKSTGSDQRRAEGLGPATAIEKERNGNEMVGVSSSREQRRSKGLGRPAENDADKKNEGEDKAKGKGNDDRKGGMHKDRDREEKRKKGKDNDRHKEKEKEKEKVKGKDDRKHNDNNTLKESGKKDQVDSLDFKPLAPHKDDDRCVGIDGNINKKRKDFEMNGLLHENDVRLNKFPRPVSSSHPHLENGRRMESYHIATPHSSIGHGAKDNTKAKNVDNKEQKINGTVGVQPSSVDSRPSGAVYTCQNGGASLKPLHPDSKHLNLIYTVPKMEEWPDFDNQEWLFGSDDPRPKLMARFEAEETPMVWAEALQIEAAEFFALPYIIPY